MAAVAVKLTTVTWQDGDGRLYRFQELYGSGPEANTGLHLTDEETAERIVAFEKKLGVHDRIKRRLAGSDCFAKQKVFLEQGDCGPGSRKRKLDALKQRLRVRRDSEGKPVELPMLVVYRCCKHFTRTVPLLVYDLDNPEDVDTELEDHAYDDTGFIVLARLLGDTTAAPSAAARMAKVGKKKMF
jgi:hypothetical protein